MLVSFLPIVCSTLALTLAVVIESLRAAPRSLRRGETIGASRFRRMKPVSWAMLVAVAFPASACGHPSSTPPIETVTVTAAPSQGAIKGEFVSVVNLADVLYSRGYRDCTVPPDTPPHGPAECEIATRLETGEPATVTLSFLVWDDPARAAVATAADINFARTMTRIDGKVTYFVTGSNWYIRVGDHRALAEQIANDLSAELRDSVPRY